MFSKQRFGCTLELQPKFKTNSKKEQIIAIRTNEEETESQTPSHTQSDSQSDIECDTESDTESGTLLKKSVEDKQVTSKDSLPVHQCKESNHSENTTNNENKTKQRLQSISGITTVTATSTATTTTTAPSSASAMTAPTTITSATTTATNRKQRITDVPRIKGIKMEGNFFKKHMKFRLGIRKQISIDQNNIDHHEHQNTNENENEWKEYEIERKYEEFECLYYHLVHKLQSQFELQAQFLFQTDHHHHYYYDHKKIPCPRLPKTLSYIKLNENKIIEHCCELQMFIIDIMKHDIFYYDPYVQLFFRKK